MALSISDMDRGRILANLSKANREIAEIFPGESTKRQPIHVVYGGAHLFSADIVQKFGSLALKSLDDFAPDFVAFANALGIPGADSLPKDAKHIAELSSLPSDSAKVNSEPHIWLAHAVYARVRAKLNTEPIEDFRIDFEDGFGNRSDDEEDAVAESSALELTRAMKENLLPPFIGIRIKSLTEELKLRAIRTLDIFISTLLNASGGKLPENFVVTLPKITCSEQISALVRSFEAIEAANKLPNGTLKLEIMIETPQAIISAAGSCDIPIMVKAAERRCVAAHFGAYDYCSALSITASEQTLDHPACDAARNVMSVALAGTGIWLSDGATNIMPVPIHKLSKDKPLSPAKTKDNLNSVHSAWKLSYKHIRNSLKHGFYQGWDLHPAQLAVRYGATYSFFLQGLAASRERLSNFINKAAQASLVGNVFDDAATGQGLLNFFLRARNCDAITDQEMAASGLTLQELQTKSFLKIVQARSSQTN